jgi:Tfp pilus assembly protein PilN
MWDEEYTTRNNDLNQIQGELRDLKKKVSKSKVLEEQIRNLNAQEINLGKKLLAVKQAISEKSNPTNLLLYIAKNIPSDLWLRELTIENSRMIIKGDSLSYSSVGTFTDNLRSSIFVKDASIKETTSKVRESDKKRIEAFEIHFVITRLE